MTEISLIEVYRIVDSFFKYFEGNFLVEHFARNYYGKRGFKRMGMSQKFVMNRYHKSAVPKLPKKRGGKAMKRYDENFKIEALRLSDDIGVKKACEQLNVNYGTLAGWRKRRAKKNREEKNADITFKTENSRLKKEIAELKSANEILKDALGFFVQDRKK